MKRIFLILLALMFGNHLDAQENNSPSMEQKLDMSLFEAYRHIEGLLFSWASERLPSINANSIKKICFIT